MLDVRSNSILYQSQAYLVTLVNTLITNKRLGKALNKDWDKADRIIHYFEAWTEREKLDDIDQMNYILECLILLCDLYQYPSAPTFNMASPPAIVAEKGEKGDQGDPGEQGATGMATDIQITAAATSAVDSFPRTSAKAARWDYVVSKITSGEQRAGSVVGTWNPSGSTIDYFDHSTNDIIGSTEPISFEVQLNGSNIQLVAVIVSGFWNIVLTRYFIPNNGTGTGPISNALADGLIFIGNASNQAEAQPVSGVLTLTNTGVTGFVPGIIVNADINASAGIAMSKLIAMAPSQIVITSPSGFLDVTGVPTLTELSYLSGLVSNAQGQINTKMSDPMTTIGDIIYRDGANATNRLPIGTANQVLTVLGGVPTWANVSQALSTVTVEIGDWDMQTTASVLVAHGLPDFRKIRTIQAIIRNDTDTFYYPLSSMQADELIQGGIRYWDSNYVTLIRVETGTFDSTPFNSTSYNRGWVIITYTA